jgi:hypothetical protein
MAKLEPWEKSPKFPNRPEDQLGSDETHHIIDVNITKEEFEQKHGNKRDIKGTSEINPDWKSN